MIGLDGPDLADYFARIGLPAAPQPGVAGLGALVRAHRLTIAFENLAIRQGRGIDLSLPAIVAKLVRGGRGGYCFEHNLLLSAALAALGVAHRPLLARVWLNLPADTVPPRTHLFLAVEADGEIWLADAGFGGGYAPPLLLGEHPPVVGPDGSLHRLRRIGAPGSEQGEWLLERSADRGERWQPQYGFDTGHVAMADIECANHWTATRPGTRFTSLHIASRITPSGMISLVDRDWSELADGAMAHRRVESASEWRRLIVDRLGLAMSETEVAALPLFA